MFNSHVNRGRAYCHLQLTQGTNPDSVTATEKFLIEKATTLSDPEPRPPVQQSPLRLLDQRGCKLLHITEIT